MITVLIVQPTETIIITNTCIALPQAGIALSTLLTHYFFLGIIFFPHFSEKVSEMQKLSNLPKVTCKCLVDGRTRIQTSAVWFHGLLTMKLKCEEIVFITLAYYEFSCSQI